MATVCCDTSFLISLYGNDPNTATAKAEVARLAQPVTVTTLNEFEMLNALRLAVFRRVATTAAAGMVIRAFRSDLTAGKLLMLPCDLDAVLTEAGRLSDRRTPTGGHRGFDILLIAAALHLGATVFLTFDAKQSTLAAAEGLTVRP